VPNPDRGDFIDWDAGREGYQQVPVPVTYAPIAPAQKRGAAAPGDRTLVNIRREERLGSLIAAAGTIWAVYVGTHDYTNLLHLQFSPPGPLEVCALGILAWLHAKWRRSLKRV
jgi:hypothetical protein